MKVLKVRFLYDVELPRPLGDQKAVNVSVPGRGPNVEMQRDHLGWVQIRHRDSGETVTVPPANILFALVDTTPVPPTEQPEPAKPVAKKASK